MSSGGAGEPICLSGARCVRRGGSPWVCDGDSVVRCHFGNLVTDDCAMRDEVCATDSSEAFCAPDKTGRPMSCWG